MWSPVADTLWLVDGQLAELEMISPAKQQAIVGGPFNFRFFLFITVAVAMEDLLRTLLYHTYSMDQSDGIYKS